MGEEDLYRPPESWDQDRPDEPLPPRVPSRSMPIGGALLLVWVVWAAVPGASEEPPQPIVWHIVRWTVILFTAFTAIGLLHRRPWSLGLAVPLVGFVFLGATIWSCLWLASWLTGAGSSRGWWLPILALGSGIFVIPWYRMERRLRVRALMASQRRH